MMKSFSFIPPAGASATVGSALHCLRLCSSEVMNVISTAIDTAITLYP